ncbi:MAG: cell wall hydrolase [Lachnospiraceae bacterium]|nr:cell wall hydrolase [Lachnospiraceae bacterium]
MLRSKKLLSGCLAFFLFATMLPGAEAHAAIQNNALDQLVGGLSSVLNPVEGTTEDAILSQAEKLHIQLVDISLEEEEESTLVMANVKNVLNVRSEPAEDAEKVGKLYKDCGGTIIDSVDGWTKIRSGNLEGWCNNDYLLFGDEAEQMAAEVGMTLAVVNTETLRVRKGPGTEEGIMGLVPNGEVLEVVDDSNEEWVCVDYEGADGYISAEFVTTSFHVDAGETLEEIKEREKAEAEAKRHVNYDAIQTDEDTTRLLGALIQCEAGGESYEGQVAVGAVVMNRVRSSAYPDSIYGVIFASGQFTPAMNGKVAQVYNSGKIYKSCLQAAQEAINGTSNVGSATHFRRNDGRDGIVIGNHVFY